ncbi:hypothetical protein POV26_05850 [Aequorivita todarodis]|uniref:hypothetical protein n=1 Tax=Aequorivita todarodis TaxID=2036821 RepID=UPI00235090AA|nr:hypothetical protein [Aequorivita todarodis]MDC8000550.1 hypothetical protein [Aequorivita todarodis]
MVFKNTLLPFSLFLLLGTGAFSQTNSQNKIYETYDNIVGLDNTGLFNGTEFTDLFLNTDGTYRYFNGYDYAVGSVTYNGQYYVNVFLKYDLLEDNLLTRSDDNLSIFNVKLIPEFVGSFSIYGRNFVSMPGTNLEITGNGYFEAAYLGNKLDLYIKHTKKKKDKPLKNGVQYRFSEYNFYVLKNSGNYTIINSERELRKLLPEKEDEIRNFYKSYKALYKSDPDSFMTKLVKYLDGLETEKNQQ